MRDRRRRRGSDLGRRRAAVARLDTPHRRPPVLPFDDDLVVVPLGDVAAVGHDVDLELVGLPLPAHPLLHGLPADHQLAGRLDLHQTGHPGDLRVGVVLLDRVDERPRLLGVLQVDAHGAGLGVRRSRLRSLGGRYGNPHLGQRRGQLREAPFGGAHDAARAGELGDPPGVGPDGLGGARVPAGDDLAEHLAVRLAVAGVAGPRLVQGVEPLAVPGEPVVEVLGEQAVGPGTPEQGPLVEVLVQQGVQRLVEQVQAHQPDRPVALDQQLLDHPAQALLLRRVEPVLLGLAEGVGRATGQRQPDEAELLGVADAVEGGEPGRLRDGGAVAEPVRVREYQLRALLVVPQGQHEAR